MQFENFVGNAALKSALSEAFSRRRLPHAILLQGEAGLGKKTLAVLLARAAVCRSENRGMVPCGVCPSCIRALAGSHPDIRIVQGSGASGAIPSVISIFAFRMPSREPRNSMCMVPTLMMTPTSGRAISER